jgi:hypothetical protein
VRGERGIHALNARLVATGNRDADPQLIGDDRRRHAAEEGEGPGVTRDLIGELLGERRLGVGVARRAEYQHEELDGSPFAGRGIGEPRRLPGVVDEALLADTVHLAHHAEPP